MDSEFCRSERVIPNLGPKAAMDTGGNVPFRSSADNNIANSTITAMAPNLALHKHALIQAIINNKL